jgi:hypothetical protein
MVNPGRTGPSLAWFILPGILLVAALVLAELGLSSFVHFVTSDIRPYRPGASISVTGDGFTVYVRDDLRCPTGPPRLCRDGRSPDGCPRRQCRDARDERRSGAVTADLRCTARSSDREVLLPAGIQGSMNNEQGSFVSIASTPPDLPSGRYVLSCVSAPTGTNVPVYLGPRFSLAAVGRGVILGIIVPVFLGFCAVLLFALLAILRYRSRRIATVSP